MSAITAKASRKMKKYAVLTREPRCFLGSFDFSWEQRKLSELTSMHARIGWQNLRTSEFLDSGNYMLITGTDFNDGAINFSTCHYVERERYEQDRNIQIHNGSILITKDGTLGKVAYVQGLSMPATLNAGVFNVQIKDANNVDEKYLFQYLKAPFLMDYVDKKATGGTIKHLNQSILVDFPVILPQRSEQTLIGAFFQQLDNLITLHQRKCALLFSPFQALISMMFTTSTFSWEQRKLGELVDVCSGRDYKHLSEGTIPVYGTGGYMLSVNDALSYDRDAIGIGRKGTIDRPYILKAPFWTVDTLFYAIPREKVDLNYAFDIFQNIDWKKKDESTGVPSLSKTAINDIDVLAPKHDEQQIIGQFFAAIDNLITLHQRKCISFTGRAGRLISTVNKKRITSSWEQRKVGDLLIERNQQAPMSDEYPLMAFIANEGVAPKGERYDRSALVTDTVNKLYKKTEKGDFIYSSNNLETGSIGLNKYGKACISPVYSIFEPTGIADSDFLGRRLVRKDFINAMVKWRQGVIYGQWRIHESDFLKIEIPVPSVEEQRKIGAYLDQLDNLITLHQRKFEKLTNVKKSMLEKMFPQNGSSYPEIRFKGFTDPWEQRKFSDITFPAGEKNRDNLPLESYSITNEHGFVPQDEKFENGGTMREADKRMYYIVSPNSFAYNPARINVGSIGYQNIGKNVIVSSLYEVFKTSEDVDDRLLWHWFKSPDFQKLIMQLQEGGVRLYFYYDKLCMGEVSLPSLEEQRKIGKLFDTLDNLITLHQRKPFLMKWRNSDANRNQTNRLVL